MGEPHDAEDLRIGFSSCPNDTFMFDALVHQRISPVPPVRVVMADIEALNRRALEQAEPLPVTKLSVAAAGRLLDRYSILDAGAALGRGCGPLVVAPKGSGRTSIDDLAGARVAIPGEGTTAYLLLRIFAPADLQPVPMRFDQIMPAVAAGHCDAGLIIHESRFTYPEFGLVQLADLGTLWEDDTGLPLPLGVIAAARELSEERVRTFERAIRASVEYAWKHPRDSADYVREHAQEMDPTVCQRHIDLYVNPFSATLGDEGRKAIEMLFERGRKVGLLPQTVVSPFR
jgi:1,4-dihydroxy-6-naphthoate synthase